MSRNSWALFTLCLLAGGHRAARWRSRRTQPGHRHQGRESRTAGRREPSSGRRQLATEIYEQAGVTLDWTSDTRDVGRSLTIVLTTIATAPAGLVPEAMGVAPSPGDGTRGTTAYVFMDRVTSFVTAHRVAAEYVLACALAHEIGHLLLPPNAHAADGIMRGSWHPTLFPPKSPGVPGFPPEQARLLRLRVQSR